MTDNALAWIVVSALVAAISANALVQHLVTLERRSIVAQHRNLEFGSRP